MTREALLGPDKVTIDDVPSSSSITLANASSIASRLCASVKNASSRSSSTHSSLDSFRTRWVEEDEGELHVPISFSLWMCLTKAATATEVREKLRWPKTRLRYWWVKMSAIPFAGLRTGSIIFCCNFSVVSDSDIFMTPAATLSRRALTVAAVGYTSAEVVAVRISQTSASRSNTCSEKGQNSVNRQCVEACQVL